MGTDSKLWAEDEDEDEDEDIAPTQECDRCGSQDFRRFVACRNRRCAQDDSLFCQYCPECRDPVTCRQSGHVPCWDYHLPRKGHRDLQTHIQRPAKDHRRIDRLFCAETEHSKQVKRHEEDRMARWFIVNESTTNAKDDARQIVNSELVWNERFGYLCGHSEVEQFPCLVSFIGKTGVGKSTLIRAMVTLSEKAQTVDVRTLEAPVTRIDNLEHATKPTSVGVNLYNDIETSEDLNPIFFADCEGFGAGVASAGASEVLAAPSSSASSRPQSRRIKITSSLYSGNEPHSRSEVVSTLYARFLYAFSDVVCFVSNDMQAFAAEIERLLLFVAKGYEATINQSPAKTLIYVFNQTPKHWPAMLDPEELKNIVLAEMKDVWTNSPVLEKIRSTEWASRINSTEEFLKKYFREIHFCYVPWKDKVSREVLAEQYALLRRQITYGSLLAAKERKGTWASYSAEDLSSLFEMAFKHFATQSTPFNFASAARKYDETPVNMEGHILCLLRQINLNSNLELVSEFPKVVASAFVRHCLPRGEGEIPMPPEELWSHVYRKKCSGVQRFFEKYQQCQFKSGTGSCVLLSDFHQNIHQDSNGKEVGLGGFELGQLEHLVQQVIQQIRIQFAQQYRQACDYSEGNIRRPRPSVQEVTTCRTTVLATLQDGWDKIHSYKSCFTCLRSLPDHVLPCGHALCEACVFDFSLPPKNGSVTELSFETCVLCGESWQPPQLIQLKPECAGVRILTLDGGGVRGILELALWQLVEKEIGLELPISRYFDLIIGTNTGGIIALGMALPNMDSVKMAEKFKIITHKAFQSARGMKNIKAVANGIWSALRTANPDPIVASTMALLTLSNTGAAAIQATLIVTAGLITNMFISGSIYPESPLQQQLQALLGPETSMFGSARHTQVQRSTRVAVIAVKKGGHATTFANYNRPHIGGYRGDFERGDNEEDEIKAWEAGLCSSASPLLFPPFKHEITNTTYTDGGLLHNNPTFWAMEEYKKIWASELDVTLDILVSLGSGHFPNDGEFLHNLAETRDNKEGSWASFLLDSEVTWLKFQDSKAYSPTTHHRLNVAVDWHCSLDSSHKIPDLLQTLKTVSESQDRDTKYVGGLLRDKVKEIAQQLVAKLFFFQTTRVIHDGDQASPRLEGRILCRLGEDEKALGILLSRVHRFLVVDGLAPISGRVVGGMATQGNGFETDLIIRPIRTGAPIQISVTMKGGEELAIPISGFPREFDDLRAMHDQRKARHKHQ